MANVLPPEVQKNIWRMHRARFLIVGSLVALACALLSSLALLPSYLLLHVDEISQHVQGTSAVNQQDKEAITQAQTILAALTPIVQATTTPTQVIAHALQNRPKGITIQHITYTASQKGGLVMLVGTTATREALSAFRTALSSDPLFTNVVVPVADLAAAEGGQFSITLSGDF